MTEKQKQQKLHTAFKVESVWLAGQYIGNMGTLPSILEAIVKYCTSVSLP